MVVVGDSLVAGYGLPAGEAFPKKLAEALNQNGYAIEVVNAGVSGDTTSGGLSRLEWSLGEGADLVVLELGANDALRGIPVEVTRRNLSEMISKLKAKNIEIILAGMKAPPNMGEAYGVGFNSIYPDLSQEHEVVLYPFFLEGVAANPELNLDDGIHPNTSGIRVMVESFMPTLERALESVCG